MMIEVKHLTKRYDDCLAVDDISFEIQMGEIFGILGPNGAGKTSSLECMEGLRKPSSGSIQIAGIDPWKEPRKLRNLIGVQLQSAGLPESITPVEAIKIFCAYHEISPRYDLLDQMGLVEKQNAQFSPWGSIIVLLLGSIFAFGLALYLFRWDTHHSTRRGHPILGILAFTPFIISIFIL